MWLKLRKITSKNCHNCCAPLVEYHKPYEPAQTQKGQGTPKSSSFVYGTPKATNKSPADVSKRGGRRSSCDLLTRSPVPSIKHCVRACLIVRVCLVVMCLAVSKRLRHSTNCLYAVCFTMTTLRTCGGLRGDGGPGQFDSGEKDIVTLLPQFEDSAQHDTLTVTHTNTYEHIT